MCVKGTKKIFVIILIKIVVIINEHVSKSIHPQPPRETHEHSC
jgi:hypothetical protein